MDKIDLSVVLVVRDAAEALPRWLAHLEQQTFPSARFEVLVVVEGATDGTGDVVQRYSEGAPMRIRSVRQNERDPARARNLGIREARGRWILFLALDLLASPHLVERHVQAQELHQGNALAAGAAAPHPQLSSTRLTRWFLPQDRRQLTRDAIPGFLDCCIYNLSVPRQTLLENGGFDESFVLSEFADAELAWRLLRQQLPACFLSEAYGYIWLPIPFEEERRRQYARGFSLYHLAQRTQSPEIPQRFPIGQRSLKQALSGLAMPFYLRACQGVDEDIRILGHVYRRVLRHEFLRGYAEAQNQT